MVFFQIAVISFLVLLYSYLLIEIFRKFNIKIRNTYFFIIPLGVFSIGFVLRLNSDINFVNLGYYLTDFTGLFVSVLFTTFLLLGQLKYWKSRF